MQTAPADVATVRLTLPSLVQVAQDIVSVGGQILNVRPTPLSVRPARAAFLGLALAALVGAACSPKPAALTDAERLAKGKEILVKAAQRAASAQSLSLDVAQEVTRDAPGGTRKTQKLTNQVHLRRPDRLHMASKGDLQRDFWYDGAKATIALHGEKVFGEAAMPNTVDGAIEAITTRYDVPVPMAELLVTSAPTFLGEAAGGAGWVDTVDLNGVKAEHLSFTTGETKWQVWVSQGAEPVILQAHIEYGARKTKPTHHMVFSNWKFNDTFADDMFVAKFGDDYEGIAMLQRAEQVTEAKDATAIAAAAPAASAPAAAPVAKPAAAAPKAH
jgi:hypothetical protein